MTDKDDKAPEDELDLDAETVADLDPGEEAEEVRGGLLGGTGALCSQACQDPPTSVAIACCKLNISI